MAEYLAPGVYYEEVSYRTKSISGVSTTTTGFIGSARSGPIALEPRLVTSLEEFERTYGDGQKLIWSDGSGGTIETHNYLWHAVRGFFLEGGRRLYISRVFRVISETNNGRASATLPASPTDPADAITVHARFPGAFGKFRVRFTFQVGQNILATDADGNNTANGLLPFDLVMLTRRSSSTTDFRVAERQTGTSGAVWTLSDGNPSNDVVLANLTVSAIDSNSDLVQVVTVTVTIIDNDGRERGTFEALPLDPRHVRNGQPDGLNEFFAQDQPNPSLAASLPIVISYGNNVETGLDVLNAVSTDATSLQTQLQDPDSTNDERSWTILLADGNDGMRPTFGEYEGTNVQGIVVADSASDDVKFGLRQFEDIEDISIVAAPGATAGYEGTSDANLRADIQATINALLTHARNQRYRIAVLDSSNNQSVAGVRRLRARFSSTYGALYYPWITIQDPITRRPIHVPPSGFVAGIYARNDNTRGVFKAPANEVVNTAIGLEFTINKAQQEVLNPEGINVTRFFEGRGIRIWGARNITEDTEWMYTNVRRYFNYVGRSLDEGTQWAVFEPNNERLWDKITRAITSFLLAEWRSGALLGATPDQAFFVRCDRSTMSQYDLDQGRLICLVGIAPVKPAEFVILRVGQWTADSNR
jgi:hypothetical protein